MSTFLAADGKGTAPLLRAILHALRLKNGAVRLEPTSGGYEVLVHKAGVIDQWATLNTHDDLPSDLGSGWALVTVPASSRSVKTGGSVVRFMTVHLPLLHMAAERLGLDMSEITGVAAGSGR